MDISLLGLAFGAAPEPTSQVSGVPGFEIALEQVGTGGFIPPGASPGPEPPPPLDMLATVEEVEGTEPIAQPQKLDFQPTQKIDLDIDLPEPFWEVATSSNPETTPGSKSQPVGEAMEWLASQMMGGFFSQPIPLSSPTRVDCFLPGPTRVDCFLPTAPERPETSEPCPSPMTLGSVSGESIPVDLVGIPDNGHEQLKELYRPNASSVSHSLPKGIPDDVRAVVNVQSIQVHDSSEAESRMDAPGSLASILTVDEQSAEANAQDATPLQKKPTNSASTEPKIEKADLRSTGGQTDRVVREVAHIDSQSAKRAPGAKQTSAESTTVTQSVESAVEPTNADETEQGNRFGSRPQQGSLTQSADRVPNSNREQVELEPVIEIPIGCLDRHPAPRMFGTDGSIIIAETEPERLKSGEVDLVVKQVADKLHMLAAARPRNGVTIHLNPQDLGSITVVVKSIGRVVDTQLAASDPRVREALDQNQTRLIEAMDSRGFHLQTVTVSQQSGHSTQQESTKNWQQQSQQQNQSQSGHSHGHRGHGERQFEAPAARMRALVRRGEGVDLSI